MGYSVGSDSVSLGAYWMGCCQGEPAFGTELLRWVACFWWRVLGGVRWLACIGWGRVLVGVFQDWVDLDTY